MIKPHQGSGPAMLPSLPLQRFALSLPTGCSHLFSCVCGGESLAVFQHYPWLQNATGVSCPTARLCPHFPPCRPPPDSLPGPPTQVRSAALKPGHHCKCQGDWQCIISVLYPAVLSGNSEPPLATGGATHGFLPLVS